MGSWRSPCSDNNALRSLFVHTEQGRRQLSASSMINPLSPDWRGEKQKYVGVKNNSTTVHSFKYSILVGGSAALGSHLTIWGGGDTIIVEIGFE